VGAQDPLSESGPSRELPWAVFLGVALAASALLVVLSRNVFLFWDDFYFLGQARDADLTWGYLTDPLFKHFSPISRLVDWVFVGAIPEHLWVILLVQAVLLVLVVAATTWLMVALHGRTMPALVGTIVLAPSLTLVPLGNWWTAGVNILPALAGFYIAFGAMVQLLRGRSAWYLVPCLAGVTVAVLDYELPLMLIGYLGLWFALFGSRVTPDPWRAALRRTRWAWVGVAVICLASAVNYRVNYYDPVERPALLKVGHAMVDSLVRTLVPTAVGFHDPRSDAFSALSLVIGCAVLVAVVGWLLSTREQAWRGLLFATAGWLLPVLALVLNRLSVYGVSVVDNAIYFHLPTVLVMIGVLEAWRAPRRAGHEPIRMTVGARRVLVPLAVLAVVGGYAWSAGPTSEYQLPPGTSPAYYENAQESARALLDRGDPFTVINSDVPTALVPGGFKPYNRADRVLGVVGPSSLVFDEPVPPYFRFADTGELVPVDVEWLAQTDAGAGKFRLLDGEREEGDGSLCFTATDSSSVLWPLEAELTGPDLVVRTLATVDRESSVRITVRGPGTDGFDRANEDGHGLRPERTGVLDTVAPTSVTTVRMKGFTPGAHVCLASMAVGRIVTPAG
jgi:hypothetical protein